MRAASTRACVVAQMTAGLLVLATALSACRDDGGSLSRSSSNMTSSASTTSSTLTTMGTGYQLKIVNASTGQTMSIANKSQVAGAAIATATDGGSPIPY